MKKLHYLILLFSFSYLSLFSQNNQSKSVRLGTVSLYEIFKDSLRAVYESDEYKEREIVESKLKSLNSYFLSQNYKYIGEDKKQRKDDDTYMQELNVYSEYYYYYQNDLKNKEIELVIDEKYHNFYTTGSEYISLKIKIYVRPIDNIEKVDL